MTIEAGERKFAERFHLYLHEVSEATSMLMYTLAGIELYHHAAPQSPSASIVPQMSSVALSPILLGPKYKDALAPTGMAVQMAYMGWTAYVYTRWEAHCRNEMKAAIKRYVDDAIPPEIDVMGDFRRIRNDFIHTGIATYEHSGRCSVLKWFAVGDPIVMTFSHVIDFLNQIGALTRDSRTDYANSLAWHFWTVSSNEEELRAWAPNARLVSVRAGDGPFDGSLGVSVAFENGVFGNIAFTFGSENAADFSDTSKIPSVEVSTDRRLLLIANGRFSKPASDLYTKCLNMWFRPEDNVQGPSMWLPPVKFR